MHTRGRHFPKEVILTAIRWYLTYPLSYRQVEELLAERAVSVDHTTIHRWTIRYAPALHGQFMRRHRRVGDSWRMDETYVCIRGQWHYLYRAVDKAGKTIDFFLSPTRDELTARRFLQRAILHYGAPRVVTVDGYCGNHAAIEMLNRRRRRHGLPAIQVRSSRYLNNIVEQDHRGVKRRLRPMLGLKTYRTAAATIAGIELVHMLRKRQGPPAWADLSIAERFEKLAA